MHNFPLDYSDATLVALGGISGSWIRFKTGCYFQAISFRKYWGTCLVNLVASFCLGLLLVFSPECYAFNYKNSIILFVGVGFLGGLSTFSSFIIDLIQTLRSNRFQEFFMLLCASIFGGLLVTYAASYLSCVQA